MADEQTQPSPPPPAAPAPSRAIPWGRIALIGSLAVNLLIAGLVIGAMLGDGPRDRDPNRRTALRDLGYGPFIDALPRADRAEMGRALRREAGAFNDNRNDIRRQFEALLGALRAQPYDPAVVRRLVDDQQSKLIERRALGRRLLLERIDAMDPAARAAYADRLDRMIRRGRPSPRGQ